MLLLAILGIILFVLVMFVFLVVAIGGPVAIIIFSDVIVCVAIVVCIIRHLIKKKNNKF